MLDLLLISQLHYAPQLEWCNRSTCHNVNVVEKCKEEYKKVESSPILGINVNNTYMIVTCYLYELDDNNNKTGRSRKRVVKVKVR